MYFLCLLGLFFFTPLIYDCTLLYYFYCLFKDFTFYNCLYSFSTLSQAYIHFKTQCVLFREFFMSEFVLLYI